ncbi:zinc finger protein GLIS2-like isoform X2 [Acanthaster planci]|nr:zinc finger protein GLIS2-like isoform X2 [Acanthaster planci]
MTTKPLDLSLESPSIMGTHSLLGTGISSGHGAPNTSSESGMNAAASHPFITSTHQCGSARPLSSAPHPSQYSSLFPTNDATNNSSSSNSSSNSSSSNGPFPVLPVRLESNLLASPAGQTHSSVLLPHVCKWNSCGQRFAEMEELVSHVNERHVVLVEGEYCCKWEGCSRKGKGFNARYKMLIHVRTHTNEKPHQCPICNKSFSRLENLKIHNRSHTGERPYVCPVAGCNKRYSNSSDRFKHTRTHLEEKPYFCKVAGCDKRYTDPSSLRKHVKTFGHYTNRDHLNHFISQKAANTAAPSSKPVARILPAKPTPVSLFQPVTAVPPTSNMTGLPEGVIVYPILVHSPSLQPHYSYVTLPGHLSDLAGNTSPTFSSAGLRNDEASSKDGKKLVAAEGSFRLSQDVVAQRNVGMEAKSEGLASS